MVTVTEATTAREALSTLVTLKIWGVPVVDGSGAIVANFSVSDVRHLAKVTNQADAEAALGLPVVEFLNGCVPCASVPMSCTRPDVMTAIVCPCTGAA